MAIVRGTEMTYLQKTTEPEVLYFPDLFECQSAAAAPVLVPSTGKSENATAVSAGAGVVPGTKARTGTTNLAARLFDLVSRGSFALGRKEITEAFIAVGGLSANGGPEQLDAVIELCLHITSESYRAGNTRRRTRVWYDPFTGRLELETMTGARDSLTVWQIPLCVFLEAGGRRGMNKKGTI